MKKYVIICVSVAVVCIVIFLQSDIFKIIWFLICLVAEILF